MLPNTISNYLGTIESLIKYHNLNENDILWVSNGINRILYNDFTAFARSADYSKNVKFDGLIIAGKDWWIEVHHVANQAAGKSFEYEVGRPTEETKKDYGLFILRNERNSLLSSVDVNSFFF